MSQKFENSLSLALETPEEQRAMTPDLNVGFDERNGTWEVIVKYSGNLERLRSLGMQVEELIAGYGIVILPEQDFELLSSAPEIEYVEKPRSFTYSQISPVQEPCIATVLATPPFYTGKGVLMAILDSGVDVRRREFRNADGTSRVKGYLEFTGRERREYTKEQLNNALSGNGELPSVAGTSHGTAVAGVAAGFASANGNPGNRTYRGVARGCDLLVVNLGADTQEEAQTANIMRGVTYALTKARQWNQPLVINLSFGNAYGNHRGESLLERFLDNASEQGRTTICVGMGNKGEAYHHFASQSEGEYLAEVSVLPYLRSMTVQIWQEFKGSREITITSPEGQNVVLSQQTREESYRIQMGATLLLLYFGLPSPYSTSQEIYMEFLPRRDFVTEGTWRIQGTGACNMYLTGRENPESGFSFLSPDSQGTLTIPSTASRVISVGAYDSNTEVYSSFSGRGFPGTGKPDIVAPGENILAPWGESSYRGFTGTSFATPIVSGCAAIMMERGIVQGENPYLYGEKLKAYVRAGAGRLRGVQSEPNVRTGWGKICLSNSMDLW